MITSKTARAEHTLPVEHVSRASAGQQVCNKRLERRQQVGGGQINAEKTAAMFLALQQTKTSDSAFVIGNKPILI